MRKNIFIIQNTEIGGHLALSNFLTNLLSHYDNSNNYNLICAKVENESEAEKVKKNIKIYETYTSLYKIMDNFKFSFKTFKILFRENKIKKIDLLHCFYPNSSLLGAILFKILVNRKISIIYDVRSPWIEMSFENNHLLKKKKVIKYIMHFSERIMLPFVGKFIFISKGLEEYYVKKYSLKLKNNSSIIPSGVDIKKFSKNFPEVKKEETRNKLGIKESEIIIGYVGTLSKLRNIYGFIVDNHKGIQNNNIKFILIGDGDGKEDIQNVLKKYKLQEKFIFLGKMPQSEIPKYISLFDYGLAHIPDIFIFQNSSPLKVLEYLAAGIKVLATDILSLLELQKIFPEHIITYKSKLDFLILRKEQRKIEKNIEGFDWGYLYNEYLHCYE